MIVTETTKRRASQRYRASVSRVEHLADGKLESVKIDVPDAHGATVAEARASADEAMRRWIRDQSDTIGPKA